VITKHGRPAAVVISVEDLEGLEETLDILSVRS
jgi:prevent-host-death family protein